MIILLALAISMNSSAVAGDKCSMDGEVHYSKPSTVDLKDRIVFVQKREAPSAANKLDITFSPQQTSNFIILDQPDFLKKGPWSTRIQVFGPRSSFQIKVVDHGSNPVKPEWLNEKLLFMQVWWGRLVSTDMIINVETGEPIYVEEASYHGLSVSCKEGKP